MARRIVSSPGIIYGFLKGLSGTQALMLATSARPALSRSKAVMHSR